MVGLSKFFWDPCRAHKFTLFRGVTARWGKLLAGGGIGLSWDWE